MTSHKSPPSPPPPSSDSSLALSKTTDNGRWSEGRLRTDTSEMCDTYKSQVATDTRGVSSTKGKKNDAFDRKKNKSIDPRTCARWNRTTGPLGGGGGSFEKRR